MVILSEKNDVSVRVSGKMGKVNAAVVGAGIGGIAAAIRLAANGFEVTVYEKNNAPGGKIAELRSDGYRFDTGPSLFTLPVLAEELYELCGEKMQQSIPYRMLEVNCKYFFPEGDVFSFYHDRNKLRDEIKRAGIACTDALFQRLDRSKEVYELSAPVFLFSNFHKLSNFNTPPYKRIARKLYKLEFMHTMHSANRRDFTDPRLVKIFDRYATYNGSDPYRAPATLNMIAHLENNIGAYFPEKGMYSIVEGLYGLAVKQEINFKFGEPVKQIIVEDGKAAGLETDTGRKNYDIIVSDVDVKSLSRNLLQGHPLKRRLDKSEPSSSALILYWEINRIYPELDLHNILFAEDYKREFRSIFNHKKIAENNTVYIFISSKVVPEDAPPGCENWFVMINVPPDTGQEWGAIISEARRNIIDKINRLLNTDIEQHITGEHIASPLTIEQNTASAGGALYGAASNSAISAFLRHPNKLRRINNLYFVGGSVHPGGGIPLCLASASIVCNEILSKITVHE
ncbi:MAG: phytoene desaturase [Rikenellaceae bacterium]|nr:phytoene desaturase [Rikenellaceae bacterium]